MNKEFKMVYNAACGYDKSMINNYLNDMIDKNYHLHHCEFPLLLPNGVTKVNGTYGGDNGIKSIQKNSLNTPYEIIFKILNNVETNKTFIDLGCAMGRFGAVINKNYPTLNYYGYDIFYDRFFSAKKVYENDRIKFIHDDLTTCKIVKGDYYYMYRPNNEPKILNNILNNAIKANPKATFIFSYMNNIDTDRFKIIKRLDVKEVNHIISQVIFCKLK